MLKIHRILKQKFPKTKSMDEEFFLAANFEASKNICAVTLDVT